MYFKLNELKIYILNEMNGIEIMAIEAIFGNLSHVPIIIKVQLFFCNCCRNLLRVQKNSEETSVTHVTSITKIEYYDNIFLGQTYILENVRHNLHLAATPDV